VIKTEVWQDIIGYEGLYKVSDCGRVKSLWFKKERILKPNITSQGYSQLVLYKNSTIKSYLVHRLVSEVFIENPNQYTQVNHKLEFEKSNNNVSNLEWCECIYNNNYGTRNKRISNVLSHPVIGVNLSNGYIMSIISAESMRTFNFDPSCILKCCRGKRVTHKGYTWRYVQ